MDLTIKLYKMKSKNLILAVIIAASSLAIAYPALTSQNNPGYTNIDGAKFSEKLEDKNVVIIDVRTPGEVQRGYIKGADLFIDINSSDFETKIKQLDKKKTYYVYCQSGARSSRASAFMSQNGFTSVFNLIGGIGNWRGEVVSK